MKHLRRFLKFMHTVTGLGLLGGLAAYMIVLGTAPEISTLEQHAALRHSLRLVSTWLLMPSMLLVLVSGLLAMAITDAYKSALWVWAKALSGVLIIEATFAGIDAPAKRAAKAYAEAAAGTIDTQRVAELVHDEWMAWWIILALGVLNIAVGIWRPKFERRKKREAVEA
ncbi:MAG: hypothetical protein AAF290_16900 [Pseudomonadota bacterium]